MFPELVHRVNELDYLGYNTFVFSNDARYLALRERIKISGKRRVYCLRGLHGDDDVAGNICNSCHYVTVIKSAASLVP